MNHHKKHHHATTSHAQNFVHSAAVPAQQSELHTGVPSSITIAQAILESGWGTHHIGAANNYFGVKAHNVKGKINTGTIAKEYVDVRTREHIHGKDIYIKDHFRKYKNMTESFIDHGLFLRQNKKYHQALDNYAKTGNADKFAHALQEAGYATDPNYAHLLIKIMKKYDLYRYNSRKSTP